MHKNECETKISDFLSNIEFTETNIDPTKQSQKTIRNTTNKCNIIIPKDKKWKVNSLNPRPPLLQGFIKLHKSDKPIRPVINFQYAPAYKIAQFFTKFLNNMLVLPYMFNIRNSVDLIKDLYHININTDIRICSIDIKNMYLNIPAYELIYIITSIANGNDIHEELIKEIKLLTELIIKQNYFELNSNFYLESQGLAMGVASSASLSEIYLQHIEHNQILNLLIKHKVISYHQCVMTF
jgi:hypothetical protein